MCGIVGVWSRRGLADQECCRLLRTLAHRGPDESWISSYCHLGYGSTRLAIVDSSVPLSPSTGSEYIDVLFNGELWNYRDLAKRYGVARPISERKVLRALYQQLGRNFAVHLDGVFALVVVDKARQEVHLYRDPVGVKPLFYWTDPTGEALVFSSDVKTICQSKSFRPVFNRDYLANEFVLGFTDYDENLFEGIRQIKPGSCLTLSLRGDSADVTLSDYGSLSRRREPSEWTEDDQLGALQEAVYLQFQHCEHFPIGLLLSGGIDSSLLLFLARSMGLKEIVCFYCGSETSPDYVWAHRVAALGGYEIRHLHLSAPQVWRELAETCYIMSGTNSLLPHLCRQIKVLYPEMKVLWSGEGADELFGGYPCHGDATQLLGSWENKIAQVGYSTALLRSVERIWTEGLNDLQQRNEVFRLYQEEQLVNAHLVAHDYGGMASSLEIRLPFLDLANVGLTYNIPSDQVLGLERKGILKKFLREISGIPDDAFYHREKLGLLHGYIGVVHELRRMAHETELQERWVGNERAFSKGPFQRFWYELVRRVFVDTKPSHPAC
jgi:asparagine synthase (glutamine-hydrolysing)